MSVTHGRCIRASSNHSLSIPSSIITTTDTTAKPCVTPEKPPNTKSTGFNRGQAGNTAVESVLPRALKLDDKEENNQHLHEEDHAHADVNHDNDDASASSIKSIRQHHGRFGEDSQDVPWRGCDCGMVHERPTKVFWIQCEGPCQAWYNVTSKCVDGLTQEEAAQDGLIWNCTSCNAQWQDNPALRYLLQELSHDVLYRILEFVAQPTYRASVLCHRIAPLNRAARYFVQGEKSQGLWGCILQREYLHHPNSTASSSGSKRNRAAIKSAETYTCIPSRRASKRQRKPTNFLSRHQSTSSLGNKSNHRRRLVEEQHLLLLGRTEEAYHILEELADPFNGDTRASAARPLPKEKIRNLTVNRLKQLLQQHAPLDVNRPSPCTGRTMLQIVCAGEMAEGVIVSCIQHLLSLGANPNLYSTQEAPLANKPALYFAISRAMPKMVSTLIQAGARLDVVVTGKIRMTFDTSKTVDGSFSPLEYAQTMKRIEILEGNAIPPYWITRLNAVVRVLETAAARDGPWSEAAMMLPAT